MKTQRERLHLHPMSSAEQPLGAAGDDSCRCSRCGMPVSSSACWNTSIGAGICTQSDGDIEPSTPLIRTCTWSSWSTMQTNHSSGWFRPPSGCSCRSRRSLRRAQSMHIFLLRYVGAGAGYGTLRSRGFTS